ncbi:MAG: sigma-E processing peptidase SpoIIGA [Anaerovoracaceae bacterium]
MIVYGEVLLAENFVVGGVILYITSEILGIGIADKRGRIGIICGSLMCGIFSLVIFIRLNMAVITAAEIIFAFFVCWIAFGRYGLWKKALTFILTTYFMGGITMAMLFVTKNNGIYTAAGVYTGDMKAGLLAVFIGFSLFTSKQIIRTVKNKKFYSEHVFDVKIVMGDFNAEVKAFLDTGNGLKDPLNGNAVAVASEALWQRLEESESFGFERIRIIPYESIGAKGLLTGIRVDCINIEGRAIKHCVIARGDDNFKIDGCGSEKYDMLLSKYMK